MSAPRRLRGVRLGALAVAVLLCTLAGRSLLEGRAAMRRANEAEARGDVEATIAFSMRAATWYLPGAAHPAAAYDKLREVARRAEAVGDVDTAMIAWQAVRGASLATRGLYAPFEARAREADAQLAVLLASKAPPGVDRDKPRERLIQEHRALLAEPIGPRPLAVAGMYVGLAIVAVACARLLGALEASLEPKADRDTWRRKAIAGLGAAAVGLAMIVIALARA